MQAELRALELVQNLLEESVANVQDSLSLLTGFCDFVTRDYWKRVWVLQEIVISRSVEVYCGKEKLTFAVLHAAILYTICVHINHSKELARLLMAVQEAEGDFPPDCEIKTQFDSVNAIQFPPAANCRRRVPGVNRGRCQSLGFYQGENGYALRMLSSYYHGGRGDVLIQGVHMFRHAKDLGVVCLFLAILSGK